MRFVAAVALLAFVVSAASSRADEKDNLLRNCAFDVGSEGWEPGDDVKGVSYSWSSDGGRTGGGIGVHASADAKGGARIWWSFIDRPPTDSALKISGWIRGKGVEKAAICVQAWAGDDHGAGFATTPQNPPLRGDFEWTHVETVLPAVPKMDRLAVLAFTAGGGEAWFDDLRVERTNESPTALAREASPPEPKPGLMLARGESYLVPDRDGAAPRVLIPLPLSYREQVPLTYELRTEPAGAVATAEIVEERGNFVLAVTFGSMAKGVRPRVFWKSLVVCGERSFADVPETAPLPKDWPDDVRPWLRSTWCVQCDDPRIVAAAKPLRDGTDDVREIVRRVEKRAVEAFRGAKGRVEHLTAVEALDKQGSCTSCANLVAGLLRACGVPARILSGYPLWSGPLQTHYIVEAYVPQYGWFPIESTMCRSPWQPYQQAEVSIIPPEHEDKSQPRPCGAGGVPYLSLTEIPGGGAWDVGCLPGEPYCDHVAEVVRALPTENAAADWTAALDVARARWAAWLKAAKLDDKGRLATALQPDDVKATSAAELAKELAH
jgi:transglutaminase-like putative cysteine protease